MQTSAALILWVALCLLLIALGGDRPETPVEAEPAARPEAAPGTASPDPPEAVMTPDRDEVLRTAGRLLASCGDRSRRLVMAEDWSRMMRDRHLLVDATDRRDPDRGWDRMLVPLISTDVVVYVADGDVYRSAFIGGDPALRDELADALGNRR